MRAHILPIIIMIATIPSLSSAMTNPGAYTTNHRDQNLVGRQLTLVGNRFNGLELVALTAENKKAFVDTRHPAFIDAYTVFIGGTAGLTALDLKTMTEYH